ncbi:hypothetical protein K5549_020477, partial [Capra hircus]
HPVFRCGKLFGDSCSGLCCGSSQQSPRFIFYVVIYFRINILVYFCLISVCFALLTTMRV